MRTPNHEMSNFAERREKLKSLIKGAAIILPAHPEMIRNNDVHHPYRQDSNLFYLTGFEEPESVFVFRPGRDPETVLFVREKDEERETWDGFRYGPGAAKTIFQMDATYPIEKFEEITADLLVGVEDVYYSLYHFPDFDRRMEKVLKLTQSKSRRSGRGLLPVQDARALLGELRIHKTDEEIEHLKKACEISAQAHIEVMKAANPGVNERALHGLFISEVMKRGAAREGYGGIFAGGNNATTLHYVFNDQELREGDLFLIDAGGEYNYFTGDITRTYPVGSKFTETQKRIYQRILDVQKTMIAMSQPGMEFAKFQQTAISGLVDILLDEKALKGSKEEIIEKGTYRKYYPHGAGHWLGMDVHDAGLIEVNGKSRSIEPRMAFTIEPGLYFPAGDESLPDQLRGIGVRIEDNILITESGHENMTEMAPKEVSELEDIKSNAQ